MPEEINKEADSAVGKLCEKYADALVNLETLVQMFYHGQCKFSTGLHKDGEAFIDKLADKLELDHGRKIDRFSKVCEKCLTEHITPETTFVVNNLRVCGKCANE